VPALSTSQFVVHVFFVRWGRAGWRDPPPREAPALGQGAERLREEMPEGHGASLKFKALFTPPPKKKKKKKKKEEDATTV
jgi:hypothetical protein